MTQTDSILRGFLAMTLAGQQPRVVSGTGAGGATWRWLAEGVVELTPARPQERIGDIVLSAGVHGDETAPIEVLDRILCDIDRGALPLAARVLVIFGNPDAMRVHRRYLDYDMNRLFSGKHTEYSDHAEGRRARLLERLVGEFFENSPPAARPLRREHYDLHTAIRRSLFERFALLPFQGERPFSPAIIRWLAASGVDALMLHSKPSETFSSFCGSFGADSCTLELGKVRPFGQNDLSRFAGIDRGLRELLSGVASDLNRADAAPIRVFRVADEIIKRSEQFELLVDDDIPNFTAFPRGTLLARDGGYEYVVRHDMERIVFPNRNVKPGLRAGLMVVEVALSSIA